MINQFLTNYTSKTFLYKLKESLKNCKSFSLSVSFIKKAGLVLIEKEIEQALSKGVIGKLITSTYQNFTDIASLNKFLEWANKYPNFSCHLDYNCFGDNGYHSKGYIFENEDSYELIVGSTNITRFALLKNIEWNVSLISKEDFSSISDARLEFTNLWDKTLLLSKDLINEYSLQIDYAIDRWDMDYFNPTNAEINPNSMQRKALKELRRNRDIGVKKALIISATGSGKTYLAAFDARNFDAKRLLFIVHRDTILEDAKKTFSNVFGSSRTYGIFTGEKQEVDANFIFSTNTMMKNHLGEFLPNEFDYIVIDEAHHAVASTVKSILDYFDAEFVLGLTATPERMDKQDVFELFEKNVPFELRLRDAITNNLVVPFHYYGIRDHLIDYDTKDMGKITKQISETINTEFIINEIKKHLPKTKLRCLAFCSNIAHARLMAESFTNLGYPSIALTGGNYLGERIRAFSDLGNEEKKLQIICCVDILNEGIDIPSVNMVLFLRPTESPVIFIQQLGRGVRKYPNKDYVTVLDFIGNNYERSIQIAIALGSLGKTTVLEKAYIKDLLNDNFRSLDIPGVIIDIDSLSKEEIIGYIDNTNFNQKSYLAKDYENFKKYLGSGTPTHMDFLNSEYSPNLMRFIKSKINGKKNCSYYSFLKNIGEENIAFFNNDEVSLVNRISDLLPLVRLDEYLIINQLLNEGKLELNKMTGYNSRITDVTLEHSLSLLKKDSIISEDNSIIISSISSDLKTYLNDLLQYGINRYEIEFGEFEGPFKLYGNYYKEQIMRVLLEKSLMYMKGTKFNGNDTYCFVGLKKDKDKQEKTNYKDKFISPRIFQWESENNTTKTNAIGKKLLNTKTVHLFIRKMDDEDGITLPFTYFGTGSFKNMRESFVDTITSDGIKKRVDTLLFDILLDNEVPISYHFDFEIIG